jgi:hypothetical protein
VSIQQYRQQKKTNIVTDAKPELLNDNSIYTKRYEDKFITPGELIFKNFTDQEINLIKSDPIYFKLNEPPFNEVHVLKKRKLIETILDEENKVTTDKMREKAIRQARASTHKFNTLSVQPSGDQMKLIRTASEARISQVTPIEGFLRLASKASFIAEEQHRLRFHSRANSIMQTRIDEVEVETTEQAVPTKRSSLTRKPSFDTKMKIFEKRRKIMNQINLEKLKLHEEKCLYIKEMVNMQKEKERDDFFYTNNYLDQIKANYKHHN